MSIQGCIKLLSKPSKVLADSKPIKTIPAPAIAHLCQLSQAQKPEILITYRRTDVLIKHHEPVGPERHLVICKVTKLIQDILRKKKQLELTLLIILSNN